MIGTKFSIIIPVYNEEAILEKQIALLLKSLKIHFPSPRYRWEIIFVENGSQDNSRKIIEKLATKNPAIKPLYLPSPSYGQALKLGLEKVKHPISVIFNLDFFDLSFLQKALPLVPACDIIIGSKTLSSSRDKRPISRSLTTYFFNILLRIIFNYPGTDTHGIKVLKQKPISSILPKIIAKNELFDTELVLRAHRQGLIITELPVEVSEIRSSRYNNLKRIRNTFIDGCLIFKKKYLNGFNNHRR